MKLHIFTAIAAMALAIPAPAQTTQRLTASKANDYGIVYSLPVTELDIYVEAQVTERTPGEFQNYSRRHLGITDAIRQPSKSIDVKSVTIVPRGVADPDNRWLTAFKGGQPVYMLLDPAGMPLALNTDRLPAVTEPDIPEPQDPQPTILEQDIARQAMTEDMIRSSSLSKRAELAAQRIFELRDMRSDLLSGQADNPPADGRAMQLVLDNLSGQEAALTAMFAGTERRYTLVKALTLRPDSLGLSDEIIARLSPVGGILDPDDLSGAPLTVSVDVIEPGALPLDEKGQPKRFPKGGVAYRIPGRALVTLRYDGREVGRREVSLAQLGATFGLDPDLFTNRKAPSMAQFDPATGAVILLGPAEVRE